MTGRRTLYGASKLAAELLVEEYRFNFSIPTTINRFGVIAGPYPWFETYLDACVRVVVWNGDGVPAVLVII
jgi:nucleoside-diphosphate-sugar epimerase